jgi:hypothetical protein
MSLQGADAVGKDLSAPLVPPAPARPVQALLDQMRGALGSDPVTLGMLLRGMDRASQSVLLLIPALLLVSPLSGIPGMATLGGITIATVAVQLLLGRSEIWLPGFIVSRGLSAAKVARALDRMERLGRVLDRNTTARMGWFFAFPGQQMALAICLACGLAMPFLELVPFSATTLAVVVVVLSVALLVRDGLMAAIGIDSFGLAVAIIARLIG